MDKKLLQKLSFPEGHQMDPCSVWTVGVQWCSMKNECRWGSTRTWLGVCSKSPSLNWYLSAGLHLTDSHHLSCVTFSAGHSFKSPIRTAPLTSEPISRKQQPVTGSAILPLMDYLAGAQSHVAICYRKKNTAGIFSEAHDARQRINTLDKN